MAFTDAQIRNLKPKNSDYTVSGKDADRGLNVRVLPSGTKTFYHCYAYKKPDHYKGMIVRMRLGKYPDMKLKDARDKIIANKEKIAQGINPKNEEAVRKALGKRNSYRLGTVADLFDAYYQYLVDNNRRTVKDIRRMLENDALLILGGLYAQDVMPGHILNVLSSVVDRAPVQANRLRSYLLKAFSVGRTYDYSPKNSDSGIRFNLDLIPNPVESIPKDTSVERARVRYLTCDEIKDVINSEHIPDKHKLQIKLLLAYGSRVGEIIYMPTSELNFKKKTWTLPAARSKNVRENVLPMTGLTEQLFKEACEVCGSDDGYLFPKFVGFKGYDCSGCTSKNTLAKYVRIHCKETGMDKFVPKDLRRTFKTLASDEGLSSDILNRIQNHALHGVDMKHYNQAKYIKQKRKALEDWHSFLIKEAGF